jgi:hypothetical protein
VSVLLGNGDGTFPTLPIIATGNTSWGSMGVGDFNGDGTADLAVAKGFENLVAVLLANGDGTFQPETDYATGNGPGSVAVGDFNGDGTADLAVLNADSVSVLLGNGDGTFRRMWTHDNLCRRDGGGRLQPRRQGNSLRDRRRQHSASQRRWYVDKWTTRPDKIL